MQKPGLVAMMRPAGNAPIGAPTHPLQKVTFHDQCPHRPPEGLQGCATDVTHATRPTQPAQCPQTFSFKRTATTRGIHQAESETAKSLANEEIAYRTPMAGCPSTTMRFPRNRAETQSGSAPESHRCHLHIRFRRAQWRRTMLATSSEQCTLNYQVVRQEGWQLVLRYMREGRCAKSHTLQLR